MKNHFEQQHEELLIKLQKHGLLVIGGTGCGKTTAVEGVVKELEKQGKAVKTLHSYLVDLAPILRNPVDVIVFEDTVIKECSNDGEIEDFISLLETMQTRGTKVILVLQTLLRDLSKEQRNKILKLLPLQLVFMGRDARELYFGDKVELKDFEAFMVDSIREKATKITFPKVK